jgi:predicted RNA binding protein YcfA (HicA-like mRNA interferase family)
VIRYRDRYDQKGVTTMARHTGKGRSTEDRQLVQAAKAAGWGVERTRGGHVRFLPPEGPAIITAFSSRSGGRHKTKARLRRAGLNV